MVREGYKQTEVGVIPKDWDVKSLSELSEKITVGIASAATHAYRAKGIPLIRNQNIKPNKLDDGDILYITEEYESRFKNKRLKEGDLLTARTGYPGTTCIVPKKFQFAQSFTTLITRPNLSKINCQYLSFFINSDAGQSFFDKNQIGGGQKNVNAGTLKKLLVPVPESEEQRLIAQALSDVDDLIAALDKLIAKKRAIKTGTMQQLLTGKKRLPGFGKGKGYKKTDIGVIPEDWEVDYLGEYAEVTKLAGFEYTNYFNSYRDGGEIIVIRGVNITNNSLNLEDVKTIPQEISKKLPRSQLKKNDLVFAYVGTIGPVFLIKETGKYHLGPNTARITPKNTVIPQFLFIYFKSNLLEPEINEKISVGAQPSLSMLKIRSFKIIKPPLSEQRAIAQVLSDIDNEISALETRRAKTQAIKQGMMQELLTGKTRLI